MNITMYNSKYFYIYIYITLHIDTYHYSIICIITSGLQIPMFYLHDSNVSHGSLRPVPTWPSSLREDPGEKGC